MTKTAAATASTAGATPVPRPILAAWLALVTRPDLSSILTNPNDPMYGMLINAYGFSAGAEIQWRSMLALAQQQGGFGPAAAALALWQKMTAPGWLTPSCPPDEQLVAIANDEAD
jgi:hypothetical protein